MDLEEERLVLLIMEGLRSVGYYICEDFLTSSMESVETFSNASTLNSFTKLCIINTELYVATFSWSLKSKRRIKNIQCISYEFWINSN